MLGRSKGKKWPKTTKKFRLSCCMYQEPYIIWLSFMVHRCKMIISPVVFFLFSKLWLFRLLGRLKGKKWPKMPKNSVRRAFYLRNHTSYDLHLWNTFEKDNISECFLYFFQTLIFGANSGVKGQKLAQNDKNLFLSHSISQEAYIIWSSFLVHMCKMMTSPDAFFNFSKFWFSGLLGG